MTAREKAIEAAARGIALGQTGTPEEAPVYRLDAESAVRNAASHIESALLDRIEEKVRERRDVWRRAAESPERWRDGRCSARAGELDCVLFLLSEIREEAGE